MDDARVSYLIGYSPAAEDWDGKYHKLRVACARHGVRILAKQGYYAYPARRLANDQQTSIEAAKLSAVDAAGIGLRVSVSPSEKGPGAVHFQIAMEAADLTLSRQKDGYDGQVTVTFLVYNKDGSEAASKPEPFHLQLTPEQYDQAKKNGAPLSEDMAVNENVEKVRILLVDSGSNSVGSVTIPISAGDRSAVR